jgi:hypothetical protein
VSALPLRLPLRPPRAVRVALVLAAAFAGSSCERTVTEPDTALQIVAEWTAPGGTPQVGTLGPIALGVRVLDSKGRPLKGVKVGFAAVRGGGSVSPSSGTTDADGRASTTWTLSDRSGEQEATGFIVAFADSRRAVFSVTLAP